MGAPSGEKYAKLDSMAEEFAERWRRGERPPLQEFIDRAPDLADDIRELFPALVEMARAEPDGPPRVAAPAAPALRQVGEYRIVREIGRGGMGVVYEAEQTSLSRRVALKILPAQVARDGKALGRFQRKARAAAKLHHTNIVPVFEVGQDGDVCYYAMQFIQGQSLDQVIEELRRLRAQSAANRRRPSGRAGLRERPEENAPAVSRITQALLAGGSQSSEAPAKAAVGEATTAEAAPAPGAAAAADSSGAAVLPDRMALSGVESHLRHFFRSAARIGQQTALALAYAHQRGVLHRDVKPSNLLLDEAGVVWVADFGLAKTDDDGLTATGDVIGTFRYMAPERFSGKGDARADVYSLGLTLYELLTLRPAFDSADRLALVALVKSLEPPRPRTLDPRIPRDLETIVLKATAKEPGRRYATTEAMAEDLRRFLADEPIKARRTGGLGRLRLWSRRNPALAALTACLLLVLVAVAVGSTATAFYLNATLAQSEKHRKDAEDADEQGKYKLWQADLDHAQARRMSRQSGQRFAALRSIREALTLPTPPGRSIDELRTEAIAALCLADIETEKEWDGWPPGSVSVAFDPAFERYARGDKEGIVHVHRVSDGVELFTLPAPPGAGQVSDYRGVEFSPDGRLLQQHCHKEQGFRSRVWRLDGPEPVLVLDDDHSFLAFRPDGEQFAASYPDGTIRLFDAATGNELRRYLINSPLSDSYVDWNPTGASLVLNGAHLRILDLDTGKTSEVQPPIPSGYLWAAWSPDGRVLAICARDHRIYLWDVLSKRSVLPPLSGYSSGGDIARFSPSGERLLSTDWSGLWMLWDARAGRRLLTLPASWNTIQFSRDGGRLAAGVAPPKLRLFRYAEGTEFRAFWGVSNVGPGALGADTVQDAAGRLLAVRTSEGMALIDLEREEQAIQIRLSDCRVVGFEPGGDLLTAGASGLVRWPLAVNPADGRRTFGPPQRLCTTPQSVNGAASKDGRVVALSDRAGQRVGALLLHPSTSESFSLGPQQDVRHCAVSPDGRWVATASFNLDKGNAVKIWDGQTGRFVRDLPMPLAGDHVRFSPDGCWLLTINSIPRLWKVDGWEEGPDLHGDPLNPSGEFSPDGKLLALGDAPGVVRLLETETGRELARLTAPVESRLSPTAFTADGARLIVYSGQDSALYLFDLRAIRAGLVELGLDWAAPAYPAAVAPAPALTIDVNMGDLLQQLQADPFLVQARQDENAKDYAKAAADLRRALAVAPDHAEANNDLAWLLLTGPQELRDAKAALPLARKAVEKAPEQSLYVNTLGVALYRTGQYAEAVPVLEKSLKLSNGAHDAFDLLFLAMCRHRLGDADGAKDDRDRAVRWVADHKATQSPAWTEELTEFQAEADAVLARPPGPGDK